MIFYLRNPKDFSQQRALPPRTRRLGLGTASVLLSVLFVAFAVPQSAVLASDQASGQATTQDLTQNLMLNTTPPQAEVVPPLALPPVVSAEPEGRLAVSAAEDTSASLPAASSAQEQTGSSAMLSSPMPNAAETAKAAPERLGAEAEALEAKLSSLAPSAAATIPTPTGTADQGSFEFNPWQSLSLVAGMLLFLAAGGLVLVRFKNKGLFPVTKQEKLMEIVGTMPIAPKRSVLLVRIKGEEFAIASTEQGVTFLKTIGAPTGHSSNSHTTPEPLLPGSPRSETRRFARDAIPRLTTHDAKPAEAPATTAAAPQSRLGEPSEVNTSTPAVNPKSDLLLSALRNMRGKIKEGPNEAAQKENRSAAPSKSPAFPRYLANAFADESRRELRAREIQGREPASPADRSDSDEHQMDSVTSLIREKLREMKPLA